MASTPIDAIAKVLEMSAKIVEEELDAELNQLKQMDEDDLERLRERRLEALKKAHKRKQVFGLFLYNHQLSIFCLFGFVNKKERIDCLQELYIEGETLLVTLITDFKSVRSN